MMNESKVTGIKASEARKALVGRLKAALCINDKANVATDCVAIEARIDALLQELRLSKHSLLLEHMAPEERRARIQLAGDILLIAENLGSEVFSSLSNIAHKEANYYHAIKKDRTYWRRVRDDFNKLANLLRREEDRAADRDWETYG